MRRPFRDAAGWHTTCVLALGVVMLLGCSDEKKRPVGASCGEDGECVSGMCIANECVDPLGDYDGDGLTNGLERSLGSDPALADTDGDAIGDRAELGPNFEALDTDGDGVPDILESAVADADGDCITDQYDVRDQVADADLSPMIPVVCQRAGVCGADEAQLAVECPSGAAACDYSGVPGYASPERACDGLDENCDGAVDEGFSAADCLPPAWVAPGNGMYEAGSSRLRASIGFGPVPARTATSSRFRAEIGFSPSLITTEAR